MKQNLYQLYTPSASNYPLIHDALIRNLVVNSDPRGTLTEILKTDWKDFYHAQQRPFAQTYFSVTKAGVARDLADWHFHPGGQIDRFSVISGNMVVAIYDIREKSPTKNTLNLFLLGDCLNYKQQYTVLVPPRTLHGFVVVGKKPAILLNFPSRLYDPEEEWRLPFSAYPLADGSVFSWNKVKKAYTQYAKKH